MIGMPPEAGDGPLAIDREHQGSVGSVPQRPSTALTFCNYIIVGRLSANPFKGVPKASEAADPRRRRRAMTAELVRILDVARRRPCSAQTVRRAEGNTPTSAPKCGTACRRPGGLIYKTLVLSGLRKNELEASPSPNCSSMGPCLVELDAADEKSREGNGVVIRSDLADDLQHWLADKLDFPRGSPASGRADRSGSRRRPPSSTCRPGWCTDRDLKLAGIPKRDERGRTLDVRAPDDLRYAPEQGACHPDGPAPCGIPTPASPQTSTPTRSCRRERGPGFPAMPAAEYRT
ncbi:MAG: hypothetical protein WKF75_06865 [Singulisphaera sp.]